MKKTKYLTISDTHFLHTKTPLKQFEYKTIMLDSVGNYDKAEKLLDKGWKIIRNGLFSITLEREKK